jgi:hypothetical protein
MTKQINLVINGKDGVGKSFFATNFVQYLKDRGIARRAIDSDHENSTLTRFHPDSVFIRDLLRDPLADGEAFGREDDLILLRVRPDGAVSSWRSRHAYNLTSDRASPI